MQKNELRYLIGTTLQDINLVGPFRRAYELIAKSYLWNLRQPHLKAAWVRRSLVTSDFKPLCSDIDMTVLIDDKALPEIIRSKEFQRLHPVKDIQFIGERFLPHWIKAGGFRNRQNANWKQIFGKPINITTPPATSREETAFELGYEIHLIYRQLLKELKTLQISRSLYANQAVTKLIAELERLRQYWQSQKAHWINIPRGEIPLPSSIQRYFQELEEFWNNVIQGLKSPLDSFDWHYLIHQEDDQGFELHLHIDQQKVYVLKNPKDIYWALKHKPEYFITTSSYVNLIKGIGVQEQTLLNQLAAEAVNYYRSFNGQRVAHDLIGAMLLEPDNLEQLYYCFLNINRFYVSITGEASLDWDKIDASWNQTGKLPYSQEELSQVCVRYLDLVADII